MKFHKPVHGPAGVEVELLTAAFESYAPGQVEYVTPDWSTWFAQLLATEPENRDFDMIYVPGGWIPALARKGILADLQSIGSEFVKRWNAIVPETAGEEGFYRGIQYGLPVYGAVWSFMYNTDILQRAGYDRPPTTWDELMACAKAIQEKRLARYAYGLNDDSDGHFIDHGYVYLMAGGSGEWISDQGRVTCKNDWPIKGLSFIQEMIRLGLCNVPVHSSSKVIRDQFFAGELAMTIGPSDWLLHRQQYAPDFPLGVSLVPYPTGGRSTSCGSYGYYCIVKSREKSANRIDLLEQLLEPSFLDRHLERIGMLPVHKPISAHADLSLAVFSTQLLHYSSFLPAMDADFQNKLTSEILSCLKLEKTPQEVLNVNRNPLFGTEGDE